MKFASCCLLGSGIALSAFGAIAAKGPVQKTVIESARLEMVTVDVETRLVLDSSATKRVTLVGTDLKIVCDHMEIIALGVGEKSDPSSTVPAIDKFKYLLATGRVNIVQGDRESNCGRAEVFPRENKVELTEKPVVIDHANGWTQAGTKITLYQDERRVVVEEPVIEGPPIKDLGFDPTQAPPAVAPHPAAAATAPPK